LFPKFKPDEIKSKLTKLSRIFDDENSLKDEGAIIKDREQLKNMLNKINKK